MAGGKSRKSGGVSKALINSIIRTNRIRDKAKELSAKELVPMTLEYPDIPDDWDYDESVTKIRTFVYKWKNLTVQIANELYIAREILSVPATEAAIKHGRKRPRFTWSQYCEDIGTSRRRVNEWLVRWFGPLVHEPIWPDETKNVSERTEIVNQLKKAFAKYLRQMEYDKLKVLNENWFDLWCDMYDKLCEKFNESGY